MPKGPRGEKRPADVVGAAIMVAKIPHRGNRRAQSAAVGRAKGGKIGGARRAASLSEEQRQEMAKRGAKARWGNHD
jgi:hypothetical protein